MLILKIKICSVDCSVSNGGCLNRCTNPTTVGRDVTCSCEGNALTNYPNGEKQCGKRFPCAIENGGCSHGCTNPTEEGGSVTCDCVGTPMVLDSSGSQCGKFLIYLN